MTLFTSLRNLRKYSVTLVLLLVGVFSLGYVALSLSMQARLPSDGFLLTEFLSAELHVATRLETAPGTLGLGDEIVAIDGLSLSEWGARAWQGTRWPGWKVGQTIIYQVRRDQTTLDIPVTLRTFPVERLPLVRFGVYALVITVLIVGCYMLLRHPEETASRLIFVIALCLMLNLMLHFQVMTLVVPTLFIIESVLKFLARAFLFSAVHHFLLIFPVNKVPSPALARSLPWFHLVNPAVSLICGLALENTPLRVWLLASEVSAWLGLAMLVGGVVSILHTAITERQPAVVGQIRWIAWGAAVSILPYLLLTGLPELLRGQAILTIEITAFFLVAMPISIAIAVARYRLFDVDTLILQTFAYILFGLVLVGGYFLLKGVLHELLTLLFDWVGERHVVFVATLLITSVFWIFRAKISAYAKQLIYRDVLDAPKLLQQMTGKLTSALRLDQLTTLLTQDLPAQMAAGQGVLMLLSADGESLVSSSDDSRVLLLRSGVTEWLSQARALPRGSTPILRSAPPDWAPRDLLDFMEQQHIELAVLLRVGERAVGLWGLGPRKGRLSYTTAEVRLLDTLALQAALAVENVQLVRRMQADQHNLEQEIQQRATAMVNDRNRLSAILQNMADALLVTDPSGDIQLANPAFERLVRLASRSFLGQNFTDVLPLPKLSEALELARANPGMIHTVDIPMVAPRLAASNEVALTETVLRVSATALGDGSAVIFNLRDITHEVEVDRMKSEFISAVSHELRTPLTSIVGFAKLIARTLERAIKPALPADDETQHAVEQVEHNLKIMVAEGEHLTTIINDVLDISALDAGTLVWNDCPCDLRALTQDIVAESRALTDAKGLALVTDFEATALPLVADCERIRQVLGNLISNAIKFTEYGKITLTLRHLAPGTIQHGWDAPNTGAALMVVRDTGSGITAEGLRHIFQRFHQGGDAFHGKPKGTGLGLAICYEIITHYGGKIWVDSTVGQGSTFYFTLPLTEQGGG